MTVFTGWVLTVFSKGLKDIAKEQCHQEKECCKFPNNISFIIERIGLNEEVC